MKKKKRKYLSEEEREEIRLNRAVCFWYSVAAFTMLAVSLMLMLLIREVMF